MTLLLGSGTVFIAFRYKSLSKTQLGIGILQLLTFTMIIGWVWSICWALLLLWKGMGKSQAPTTRPVATYPPAAAQPYGAYPAGATNI